MRRLLSVAVILVSTLTTALAAPASANKIYDMAALLSGTFEGSTPGNHLQLDLRPVSLDPAYPFDLFLSVTGTFEKDNVRQQGIIRFEQQGQAVFFSYIPHFNSQITSLSADAGKFTETELSSACMLSLKPRGDGFFGDTLGSTSCSLAMRGAIGKWTLEFEPGNLRLRNEKTGETLRFRQVKKTEVPK